MPLPPLCLEDAAGHRQAALLNHCWWQDGPTDKVPLVKLVFRRSLPGSGMHTLGMVPVLDISESLLLPSTVLTSIVYLLLPLPAPWALLVSASGPSTILSCLFLLLFF